MGDNGNWAPIAVRTIAAIAQNGFADAFCNWVPVVGQHTCLKAFASQQLGEISGGNNGAQENVFDFQAAGSSPADPVFIRTAVRNPLDEPRTIHLSTRGLPAGWAAQIPHAWVWLDAKAERHIDVMVWPVSDVNAYDLTSNQEKRFPATAPFHVKGAIERSYTEVMNMSGTVPGSRFYPIGGTFYRVHVRRRGNVRLEQDKQGERKEVVALRGAVSPAAARQRVLIDVQLPDGKTRRTVETKTGPTGQFTATVKLLDDKGHLQTGTYRAQALLFGASELADAESNILLIQR